VKLDRATVSRGNPAEFLALAVAVFEVNRDFFVQTLAPLLAGLLQKAKASGDGKTRSSSSSSAAIA
jgi:hypothetical protein